jgi:hypothetical protein
MLSCWKMGLIDTYVRCISHGWPSCDSAVASGSYLQKNQPRSKNNRVKLNVEDGRR